MSNLNALKIFPVTSHLTFANRWDHLLARWGYRRGAHRVKPSLYAIGHPTRESPVFVTANYTLSFDALRVALANQDGYILVLDTRGINVWCAAGKGTFGTDELVHRIKTTKLHDIVNHRQLILPQLGASGVAAHEVQRRTGFKVTYGPVRATDLPTYLKLGQATPEMRRIRFTMRDRLVLIPVELVHILLPMLIVSLILFFTHGPLTAAATAMAILAGVILFPLGLPWLPTPDFSSKGLILGSLVTLPFAVAILISNTTTTWWLRAGHILALFLSLPPVTAYLALNFTGSTPFTSKSGVEREIKTYIPILAWLFGIGLVIEIVFTILRWIIQ